MSRIIERIDRCLVAHGEDRVLTVDDHHANWLVCSADAAHDAPVHRGLVGARVVVVADAVVGRGPVPQCPGHSPSIVRVAGAGRAARALDVAAERWVGPVVLVVRGHVGADVALRHGRRRVDRREQGARRGNGAPAVRLLRLDRARVVDGLAVVLLVRSASAVLGAQARRGIRTAGLLEVPQHGAAVLGVELVDLCLARVVAVGGALGQLDRHGEDPVLAVGPVVLVATDDVQVTALHRLVAIAFGETLAEGHEGGVIVLGHVMWHVRLRVRVRPQIFFGCGVETQNLGDLGLAVGRLAALDEVLIVLHLGRDLGRPTLVVLARRLGARLATAAVPGVAELAVEIDADLARVRDGLAVLAPLLWRAAREVVLGAVGIHHRHDPDHRRVEDLGHALAEVARQAVVVGEDLHHVQGELVRGALASVHQGVDEDLGLALGRAADVGGQLDAPDVTALVALADRELGRDVGVRRNEAVDQRLVFSVGVEVLVAGRFAGCGGDRDTAGQGQERDAQQQGQAVYGETASHSRMLLART